MPAPIVVEVYAPQPRPQELAALIAACSRAAAPNACISSDDVAADTASLGVAIVRRDRDGDRARVELGLRGAPNAEWSTRDLVFQAGDDELERYRAIGFAIGTLVAHQSEPPPPPPGPSPAPPSPPPRPPRVASPSPSPSPSGRVEPSGRAEPAVTTPSWRSERGAWVDAGGSVGLGLIAGPPRVGGALRAAAELVPRGFFAVIEGGYAERSSEPELRVRWLSLGAGLGHSLTPKSRSLGVELRLMLGVERLSVTAFDGERSASDARWKPGVAVALDGHWRFAPPFGLVLGALSFIDPEPTVVRRLSETQGKTPSVGLSGFAGLRLELR